MKDRIIFLLWLLLLCAAWIVGRIAGAGTMLIASVICTLTCGVQAASGSKHIVFEPLLREVPSEDKDSLATTLQLSLRAFYTGILPLRAELELEVENHLTGEVSTQSAEGIIAAARKADNANIPEEQAASGENSADILINIKTHHAGKISVRTKNVVCKDIAGVVKFRSAEKINESVLLLPKSAIADTPEEIPLHYDMNSDRYSETRSGDDLSEVYEVREYHDGDRMNAIHWKLSARSDDFIVKEGSYPVNNRILLLLENAYTYEPEESRSCIENACGTLIAISEKLSDSGISHHIGYWNVNEQCVKITYIDSPNALTKALNGLLTATLEERKRSILEKYYDEAQDEKFSYILVIDDELGKKHTS